MSQKQNPLKVLAEDIQAMQQLLGLVSEQMERLQADFDALVEAAKAEAQAMQQQTQAKARTEQAQPQPQPKAPARADSNGNDGKGKRPVTFPFGKYKGKTVAEVLALGKEGRTYLQWFVEKVEPKGKAVEILQAQARKALATAA